MTVAAFAPQITVQPQDQAVEVGQAANFQVTATGTDPLKYQWSRNAIAIVGATGTGYTTPVTLENDNGTIYAVVVSNPVGNAISANANLVIVL